MMLSALRDGLESENRDPPRECLDFVRGAMPDQTSVFEKSDADRYFGGEGAQYRAGLLGVEFNQALPAATSGPC
ncbi:hypothetical protein MNVI_01900 [Mycobacterium noviomagense]|uniref:Uncharacterized protein n=1 Tax=Mycobacterium noviomagense TaxID=459858 RepID=A0A7I7P8Q7_9MYCO|nr:hypothetical protein MNVI_01900 [Mycobacterium noviomagense]